MISYRVGLCAALLLGSLSVSLAQDVGLVPPNQVVAGPTSGAVAGAPRARALVNADLPVLGGIVGAVRSSSAATVTVSTTDYFLCLDPTSNAQTVNLPPSPATGLTFLMKDCTGQSATHNITVTPAAGNIDGGSTFVMNVNFQSIGLTYTGARWSVN